MPLMCNVSLWDGLHSSFSHKLLKASDLRWEEDLHVGAPRLVEEMLELCHIRTEIKCHLSLSLCLISLLHLHVCVSWVRCVKVFVFWEVVCVWGKKKKREGGGRSRYHSVCALWLCLSLDLLFLILLLHSRLLLPWKTLFSCCSVSWSVFVHPVIQLPDRLSVWLALSVAFYSATIRSLFGRCAAIVRPISASIWPLFDHCYLVVVLPLLSGFCSAALRPITAGCLCPLTVGPYGQLFLPMRLSVYGIHH